MDYLDKIREVAMEAQEKNDNNVAIVLYCLLGLHKSGMLSLLAGICHSLSQWDIERINLEKKNNNWMNN